MIHSDEYCPYIFAGTTAQHHVGAALQRAHIAKHTDNKSEEEIRREEEVRSANLAVEALHLNQSTRLKRRNCEL